LPFEGLQTIQTGSDEGTCEEAEIENDFQKVQEGCKIRRTYGIFGYTRRDKLFIFVGVGVFHPLSRRIVSTTHAPLRNKTAVSFQRLAVSNPLFVRNDERIRQVQAHKSASA
jgi:hypothetical protein